MSKPKRPNSTADFAIPTQLPSSLPVMPLISGVLMPGTIVPLTVGRGKTLRAVGAAQSGLILVAVQREPTQDPSPGHLLPYATLGRIAEQGRGRGGTKVVVICGLSRVRLTGFTSTGNYLQASFEVLKETWPDTIESEALKRLLKDAVDEAAELLGFAEIADQHLRLLADWPLTVDAVIGTIEAPTLWKREMLQTLDPVTRAEAVLPRLLRLTEVVAAQKAIQDRMQNDLQSANRDALLRRQLKTIQDELGQNDTDELGRLTERLDERDLPEKVQEAVDREVKRLGRLAASSPERSVAMDWLEWIADLPWQQYSALETELSEIERRLDESHYGLEEVKRQVLEHLAVRSLAGRGRADVLLLVGPPGVGKTSIAQAIAEATGRELMRIALGGLRDEAELRGHRRTYIGARPGRLIEGLRRAGTADPVVVLDEVDKLNDGWRGDPASALLEILDPEQNHSFTDHYLEVPFDLSKALFVATANELSTIRGPLRDRMEVIHIDGYTQEEKVVIAQRHLLSKLAENAGLADGDVVLSADVIKAAIDGWTREAGVRQLQRTLGRIYRAAAVKKARGEFEAPYEPSLEDLGDILGRQKFHDDDFDRPSMPGVATGLAWTPSGGDVLLIESSTLPGTGKLLLTGQLGDVMKESARAALTYVLAHGEELGIEENALEGRDLHIHFPAGAVPKDGPSAGVTIFTALASLLSDRPVRDDVAMTGEATLRGRVLPVGGIKSKLLAAHRHGIKRVIIPKRNEVDLDDIPEDARNDLDIVLVENMDDVLEIALSSILTAPPAETPVA